MVVKYRASRQAFLPANQACGLLTSRSWARCSNVVARRIAGKGSRQSTCHKLKVRLQRFTAQNLFGRIPFPADTKSLTMRKINSCGYFATTQLLPTFECRMLRGFNGVGDGDEMAVAVTVTVTLTRAGLRGRRSNPRRRCPRRLSIGRLRSPSRPPMHARRQDPVAPQANPSG